MDGHKVGQEIEIGGTAYRLTTRLLRDRAGGWWAMGPDDKMHEVEPDGAGGWRVRK